MTNCVMEAAARRGIMVPRRAVSKILRIVNRVDSVPDDVAGVCGVDIGELNHDAAESWIDFFSALKGMINEQ